MPERRFPPPWSVEGTGACCSRKAGVQLGRYMREVSATGSGRFSSARAKYRDANGQALACVYFEDEPGRRTAAKLLTKDEARRMGVNFAQVPGLPLPAT
jgi:hypothetical protein